MIFPEYELSRYQAQYNSKAKYRMCAAALSPLSINDIFSLANEEELAQWNTLSLSYTDAYGDKELRALIAKQYPGLSPDNIMTFCGTQEALFCAMQATVQSRDHSITIDPAYEPLVKIPESIGATVTSISLEVVSKKDISTGKECHHWALPVEKLLTKAKTGFQQLIINFPHNPTGCMIDSSTQKTLVDCCHDQNAWLISDEVFRGLEHNPDNQLPPVASLYKKGISLGSIGKPYGLGGVRIGWIACQDSSLLQKALLIKRSLSICTSRADELIAKITLKNSPFFLSKTRKLLNNHLQKINDNATSLINFNWVLSEAGCISFPSIPNNLNIESFAKNLISEKSIMIIPGRCFSNNTHFQQHFRLGFGQENFLQVWSEFSKFFNQQ